MCLCFELQRTMLDDIQQKCVEPDVIFFKSLLSTPLNLNINVPQTHILPLMDSYLRAQFMPLSTGGTERARSFEADKHPLGCISAFTWGQAVCCRLELTLLSDICSVSSLGAFCPQAPSRVPSWVRSWLNLHTCLRLKSVGEGTLWVTTSH